MRKKKATEISAYYDAIYINFESIKILYVIYEYT